MRRSIPSCLILSFVTCGLYAIYWFIVLCRDLNRMTPNDPCQSSGVKVLLLSLVTCGIYGIYWNYVMGRKVDSIEGGGAHTVIFLVLSLVGLGIINCCIVQNTINDEVSPTW